MSLFLQTLILRGISFREREHHQERDGWRKLNDNQWTLLSSEPPGQQWWQERPPIPN
jgi:hypothetical protein